MRINAKEWKQSLGVTALISMAVTVLSSPLASAREVTPAGPKGGENDWQIAQESLCREIDAYGGLNVRQNPSIGSDVTATLPDGQAVIIENRGANGWVPITEPVQGFVAAEYLNYCRGAWQTPATPVASDSCRQIDAYGGLNVRENPSIGSDVITTLPDNRAVTIQGAGQNGWVPISEPVQGFVAAEYLNYCPSNWATTSE